MPEDPGDPKQMFEFCAYLPPQAPQKLKSRDTHLNYLKAKKTPGADKNRCGDLTGAYRFPIYRYIGRRYSVVYTDFT